MPFPRLGPPEPLNPRPWDTCAVTRIAVAALLLTACGGGADLLLPGDGEATHISIVGGDNQSGRVGEPLKDPLVVGVTDSRGRPVNGASVAFEFTSAGPEANIVPATATTNSKGEATAQLVLGTTIGPQTGQASVVTQGAKPPTISFTVMAVPKNANGIAAVSGDDQTGAAGSKLREPLVVQVTDAFGNPISGVRIDWTAEGGGSVSDASNTTDESGRASVERTLGPTAGPQTTLASSEGLAGSPVTFTHTATAGNASSLSIVSGNNQTATAGTRLPADLVVRLVDGEGNGVPGTAVAWVVGIGGGSVTPQNGTTDGQGRASAQWTLGPDPGDNRVDAVVSGIGIANFRATGTPGAPAALAILTQPSGSARNGLPFGRQPVVQVRDGQGNDVAISGVLVTAQLSGSGGELIGTRQQATGANGRASFTDLAISGATGQRTLVFTASGYAGVTSTPIDVSAIATTTTITSDLPDPSVAGSTFTVEFRVTSAGPTPTGTVTVTVSDGAANCSGTLQNGVGSCQLTLARVGNRRLKATYSADPGFNGSSGTETHRVTAAPPQNQPPRADYNWNCEGFTCAFTDNSRDSDGNIVSRSWSFGDGSAVSTEKDPLHTYPAAGTYTVTLTVTDNDGATDQASAAVKVEAPPPPPPGGTTTTITGDEPDPSVQGAAITVTFTVTSPSGTPSGTVQVTDPNGGSCTGSAPSGSCTLTPGGVGTRTLTARYQSNSSFNGSSGTAQHTVNPANSPPTAAFNPPSCTVGQPCSFIDGSSDPDGTVVGWSWTFGDGGTSNEKNPLHTYSAAGSFPVTLTVTDNAGASSTPFSQNVTVAPAPNQAPTAAFTWDACPALTCTFTDESTDDGTIVSWSWDFGDPASPTNTSTDKNPVHLFTAAGPYTVTLTVSDNGALTGTLAKVVTVP